MSSSIRVTTIEEQKSIANGLAGVLDRYNGFLATALADCSEAKAIADKIQTIFPMIQVRIDQALANLQVTQANASSQQWQQALTTIIQTVKQQTSDFDPTFTLQDWLTYLPANRKPSYDIIFVGGGPIGLWTALLAKIQRATLSILVFEKRTTYVRPHTLSIDSQAFANYVSGANADLDNLVDELKNRNTGTRIQEIESSFLKIARKVGVQIEYATITNPENLPQIFPEVKIFIGSDGARSVVREKVFGDDTRLDETIHRLIQIVYEINKNQTANFRLQKGGIIDHAFSTIASMSTTLIDERTSQAAFTTQKILTFASNERLYKGMDGATFANPYTLSNELLPKEIKEDFYLWCGMKEEVYGEVRILDSEKLTRIDGQARIAQTFVKGMQGGKIWCLLGDAAASFPLQRGFNVALKCGIELANTLFKYYLATGLDPVSGDGIEGIVHPAFKNYADFGKTIEEQELCYLYCPLGKKRDGIRFWKVVTTVVPKLDSETKSRYLQIAADPGKTPMGQMPITLSRVGQMLTDHNTASTQPPPPTDPSLSDLQRIQLMMEQHNSANQT